MKSMLGHLFGSNARVRILKLFLLHPEEKYYIRQISRELKVQLNSVRRELENLEKFGLLISGSGIGDQKTDKKKEKSYKQEKKYFQINKEFVLFEEIKSLIVKAQVLYEKDFILKMQKTGKPKLLILAGIFVNNYNSQVDLLVVGRFNKSKLYKTIKELENEFGQELNFTILDTRDFNYRRAITDVFLYEILEGKKIVVVDELGVTK